MNAGKIIKILFYAMVVMLVIGALNVAYHKYFGPDTVHSQGFSNKYKLYFKDIKIPKPDEAGEKSEKIADQKGESTSVASVLIYDFKPMLDLIDACEKVKYLDFLRFSRPEEAKHLNPETLQELMKAMHSEKTKLKKHIRDIKSCADESIPTKHIKALKYYLRVMEANLQDLNGIVINAPS